jgi:transposase
MWCIGEITPEYRERMEDVLATYERPYRQNEPVICVDERPVQLLDEKREPCSMRPGKIARRDSEYIRCGTANIFCVVEPKAGRHFTRVTKNRKGPQFASMLASVAAKYPKARKIHLVMDNLNTHREQPLIERYGCREGRRIWNRFIVHYTPKHGSWLNQAEIEISLLSRLCLGKRRIADIPTLRSEVSAWNRLVNRRQTKIDWRFDRKKARKTFGYKAQNSK